MSKIEWTDETWNVTTGCTRVSAGCDNCYAARMTKRLAKIGHTEEKYGGLVNEDKDHFNGKIKLHPEVLNDAFNIPDGKKIFVNSMSDLFHPDVPFEFIDKVFAVMALNPTKVFQVLTKRPERMAEYLNQKEVRNDIGSQAQNIKDITNPYYTAPDNFQWMTGIGSMEVDHLRVNNWPVPNIWIGTSCEDQSTAGERVPHLLECPATARFLSCEPLMGSVDITRVILPRVYGSALFNALSGEGRDHLGSPFSSDYEGKKIHWVVAGGESGPEARPMHPDWVRSIRDQCKEAGVPFFFKQWGAWRIANRDRDSWKKVSIVPNDGSWTESTGQYMKSHSFIGSEMNMLPMVNVSKKKAGRELDGKEWNQFPENKQQPNHR